MEKRDLLGEKLDILNMIKKDTTQLLPSGANQPPIGECPSESKWTTVKHLPRPHIPYPLTGPVEGPAVDTLQRLPPTYSV